MLGNQVSIYDGINRNCFDIYSSLIFTLVVRTRMVFGGL